MKRSRPPQLPQRSVDRVVLLDHMIPTVDVMRACLHKQKEAADIALAKQEASTPHSCTICPVKDDAHPLGCEQCEHKFYTDPNGTERCDSCGYSSP